MGSEAGLQLLCVLLFESGELQAVGVLLEGFLLPKGFLAGDDDAVFRVAETVADEPVVEDEAFQDETYPEEEPSPEAEVVSEGNGSGEDADGQGCLRGTGHYLVATGGAAVGDVGDEQGGDDDKSQPNAKEREPVVTSGKGGRREQVERASPEERFCQTGQRDSEPVAGLPSCGYVCFVVVHYYGGRSTVRAYFVGKVTTIWAICGKRVSENLPK